MVHINNPDIKNEEVMKKNINKIKSIKNKVEKKPVYYQDKNYKQLGLTNNLSIPQNRAEAKKFNENLKLLERGNILKIIKDPNENKKKETNNSCISAEEFNENLKALEQGVKEIKQAAQNPLVELQESPTCWRFYLDLDKHKIEKTISIALKIYNSLEDKNIALPLLLVIDRCQKSNCQPTSIKFWENIDIVCVLYDALYEKGYYNNENKCINIAN